MGITFTFKYSLSLSFGFNTLWYSSNLFPNAFPRIKCYAKKNRGLSRFFSFLEFSVIYWIRNNFPILCYLLLLRVGTSGAYIATKRPVIGEDGLGYESGQIPDLINR